MITLGIYWTKRFFVVMLHCIWDKIYSSAETNDITALNKKLKYRNLKLDQKKGPIVMYTSKRPHGSDPSPPPRTRRPLEGDDSYYSNEHETA